MKRQKIGNQKDKRNKGYSLVELMVGSGLTVIIALLVFKGSYLFIRYKQSLENYKDIQDTQVMSEMVLKRYFSRGMSFAIDSQSQSEGLGLRESDVVEKGGIAFFHSLHPRVTELSKLSSSSEKLIPIAKFWTEQQRSVHGTQKLRQVPVAVYFKIPRFPQDPKAVGHKGGQLLIYTGTEVDVTSADASSVEFNPENSGNSSSHQVFPLDNIVELKVNPEGYGHTATGVRFHFVYRHFLPGKSTTKSWCPTSLVRTLRCVQSYYKDIPSWVYIRFSNSYHKPDKKTFIPRAIYSFQPEYL
jgi:hypothetical protein